jgi:hypothetical protein
MKTNDIAHNVWPRYASSNIFFSSTIEYIMAQAFHTNGIVDIIGKMILSNPNSSIRHVIENSTINSIQIPVGMDLI